MKNKSNGNNLTFLKVVVAPSSKKEKISWVDDKLILEIKEAPKNGEANKRMFEILSLFFPEKRIQLVKGFSSKNKILKIYANEK